MPIRTAAASLTDSANLALTKAELYLADPVTGGPAAPGGSAPARINVLWGNAGWIVAVVCCFVVAGLCAVLWKNRGQQNEHVGQIGLALGGALAVGSIGAVVGALTGT